MILDDLIRHHFLQIINNDDTSSDDDCAKLTDTPGSAGTAKAFILGINAPPGCGKSTLVQLLKFLLIEIAAFENKQTAVAATGHLQQSNNNSKYKPRVCIEVSQDDFYRTKADRQARGIPSRMEIEGMDTDLCASTLAALADWTRTDPVDVPRFSKARDDREPPGTTIVTENEVDIILFEGWRVGIDHTRYVPLMDIPDFMLCIDADFNDAKAWKFEQSKRDAERAGLSFDANGLDRAWNNNILPVIEEYSGRVKDRADWVLSKGAGHVITQVAGRNGSTAAPLM
jgi:pantothenate kinase